VVSLGWDRPGPRPGLRGLVTGLEAAFLDHRVVGLRGFEARCARTSATVGATVAEVRRPLGLRLEAR